MAGKTRTIGGKTCVTSAFLAEMFGVTSKTLSEWEKKGCPKVERGYWCPADVIKWRSGQRQGPASEPEDMSPMQRKLYWDAECKKAQTEAQQFKNAVVRGEYLEKEQAGQELYTFFTVFKQTALALPRRAAVLCAQYIGNERARQLENELMKEVQNVLAQWSGGTFRPGLDPGCAESAETAGKDDGKRVGGQKPRTRRKKQQ